MIKKLLLVCALVLSLFSCTKDDESRYISGGVLVDIEDYIPEDVIGFWPIGLSATQKETILLAACAKTKWNVVNRSDTSFEIMFENKTMRIYAEILYTDVQYSIRFIEWGKTTLGFPATYRYYTKLVNKLDKNIKKRLLNAIR